MTIRVLCFVKVGFIFLGAVLGGCGGGSESDFAGSSQSANTVAVTISGQITPQTAILPNALAVAAGEFLFKDVNLSTSKKMACASCHTENSGHADKSGTQLPFGGPLLLTSGMRSSPTVRYLNENTVFKIDKNGRPSGGFTWDGRADSRKEQAGAPFFEHQEMGLSGSVNDPRALTALVRAAAYYPDIQKLYKPTEIDTDAKLFEKITSLIEIYQRDDKDYNLFDSRYDKSVAKKETLSPAELRGLALFKDTNRGNCISCHGSTGEKQLFTNFGYAALAAPRNHLGPKNSDAAFFDLGLCMRERASQAQKERDDKGEVDDDGDDEKVRSSREARYCGMFKTPTLRNIERTAPYFHNASVPTLEAAVRFHFERDTQPGKYYRRADGTVDRPYNDMPGQHLDNIARGKPFNGSYSPTDAEIADLLAFLKTLNDADQIDLP